MRTQKDTYYLRSDLLKEESRFKYICKLFYYRKKQICISPKLRKSAFFDLCVGFYNLKRSIAISEF